MKQAMDGVTPADAPTPAEALLLTIVDRISCYQEGQQSWCNPLDASCQSEAKTAVRASKHRQCRRNRWCTA